MFTLRAAKDKDLARNFKIWCTSVLATHHFLSTEDFGNISELVEKSYLLCADLIVAVDADDLSHGFMGATGDHVRRLAGKEVLGEIRPVGGRRLVVAEHDDAPGILLSPQHFRGGKAGRTAADDDDLLGICFDSTLACCRFSTLALSNDEDMAVALFHPPARQQPERGCA